MHEFFFKKIKTFFSKNANIPRRIFIFLILYRILTTMIFENMTIFHVAAHKQNDDRLEAPCFYGCSFGAKKAFFQLFSLLMVSKYVLAALLKNILIDIVPSVCV